MADQTQRWLTLTTRFGQEIENPNQDDCRRALEELSCDSHEGMTAADLVEHSTAYLRLEADVGPHSVLAVCCDGTVTYSQFESPEADDPVVELTQKVASARALELMMLLAADKCDQLEEQLAPMA